MPVGPHGVEEERVNGRLMRTFMEAEMLYAVNTWKEGASGRTWIGGGGRRRVDYVIMEEISRGVLEGVWKCEELHEKLRMAVDRVVNDHVPVGVRVRVVEWAMNAGRRVGYDVEVMVRSCLRCDERRGSILGSLVGWRRRGLWWRGKG